MLLKKLEKILDNELLDQYILSENDKELFNENLIIENCFKILTLLGSDFQYPATEFASIEAMLKVRQKTVKKPKRKAAIEGFISFLFNTQ